MREKRRGRTSFQYRSKPKPDRKKVNMQNFFLPCHKYFKETEMFQTSKKIFNFLSSRNHDIFIREKRGNDGLECRYFYNSSSTTYRKQKTLSDGEKLIFPVFDSKKIDTLTTLTKDMSRCRSYHIPVMPPISLERKKKTRNIPSLFFYLKKIFPI